MIGIDFNLLLNFGQSRIRHPHMGLREASMHGADRRGNWYESDSSAVALLSYPELPLRIRKLPQKYHCQQVQ